MLNEFSIAVPQADDLDKVVAVVELVVDGCTTAPDIAARLEMVNRQGLYYCQAAEILGFVKRDDEGNFSVAKAGQTYLKTPLDSRADALKQSVYRLPLVREIGKQLGIRRILCPPQAALEEALLDVTFTQPIIQDVGDYAEETALRRAHTLRAWAKHFTN